MVRITVHEHKSEAFDYSRTSTPVAKAYELLDDYFCGDTGALSKDAVEKVLLTFRNDRGFYDRSKLKAVKSYSLAWDALLREIQATLEWDDEFPHATKLSSEQVKKWFASKGRDFKEDLKPLVDAIDRQRKEWWGDGVSNKGESRQCEGSKTPDEEVLRILTDMEKCDELAEYIDLKKVNKNLDDLTEQFEFNFDFDEGLGRFVSHISEDEDGNSDDESEANKWNSCAELTDYIMDVLDIPQGTMVNKHVGENWETIQWRLFDGGIENVYDPYEADESKKSESFVTDLTKAIQDSKPEVLLSDDAVTYFNDYDDMLDEFEGAYQTVIHVNGKHEVEEMMFLYVPDDNIVAIGDFDVDRADAERAKELMEKFVRGELTEKPGNSDDLESVDYIAIVDGNTYTSTVFVEG